MFKGEIRALHAGDIQGTLVHVRQSMVQTTDNTWVEKEPKPYTGNRYIDFSEFVANKFKGKKAA